MDKTPKQPVAYCDLNCMAVLDSQGIRHYKVSFTDRLWAFYPSKKAVPVIEKYRAGTLHGNLRTFVESQRRIRDLIFDQRRKKENEYRNQDGKPADHDTAI